MRDDCDGALGRVTRLSIAPVKGLGLNHPEEIAITKTGAVGDREFYLSDRNGRLLSITRTGALVGIVPSWDPASNVLQLKLRDGSLIKACVELGEPHSTRFWGHSVVGRRVCGPWETELSSLAGRDVTLVKADEPNGGVDAHPVTLLGARTLTAIAEDSLGIQWDGRRFRMLIEFDDLESYVEDSWVGHSINVGEAALSVVGPVPRCAATTRDPSNGQRDLDVLRVITRKRGLRDGKHADLGVYADVIRPGRVRVGDSIRALCAGRAKRK